MGTYAGGKYASSHTTAIQPAADVLRAAERDDRITKISLGVISLKKGGHASLRCHGIPAGMQMRIRGPSSLQEFVLYMAPEDRYGVFSALSDIFRAAYQQAKTTYTEEPPVLQSTKKRKARS